MSGVRAGQFNRRVELLRKPEHGQKTLDSVGEPIDPPVKFGETWAKVSPLGGTEPFVSDQSVAKVTMKFELRWRPDLNPLHYLKLDGRIYDVVSVEETQVREVVEVRAWARAEGPIVEGTG